MAIEKMRLLRLAGQKENIEEFLLTAFATYDLHAELAAKVINEGNGGTLLPEDNRYADYLNRIENIISNFKTDVRCAFDGVSIFTADQIERELAIVENNFEKITETKLSQSTLTKEDLKAINILREYDIDAINHTSFVTALFGRLPVGSLHKISLHDNVEHFDIHVLIQNNNYAWILCVSLIDVKKKVLNMLESLYFEPINIPKVDEQQLEFDCESIIGKIYGFVRYKADIRKFYKYIAIFDNTCVITGFVPEKSVNHYKALFGDMRSVVIEDLPIDQSDPGGSKIEMAPDELGNVFRVKKVKKATGEIEEFVVQDFPAALEEGLEPPTVLRNNWFAKPFELFVEMYGLPHYGEFDPTFFMSITYALLFGIMFGDLGQGVVLFFLGYFLYKKTGSQLWAIVQRISISSMFFGTLFGSVFGYEHLLDPMFNALGFHEKPIEVMANSFTMPLLLSAVGLGAFLILSSIILNTILKFKKKHYGEALFSQNGVAGIIFYGSIIVGVALQMGLNIQVVNPITISVFIVMPLLMILFHIPLGKMIQKIKYQPHEGWGGFLIESIFELLEVVLSFMTNTMSFLRVGGFVLSHAGMMLVVMTLREMTGNAGIVVVIIGNIFVMGLEGLIVGIQTLRLEYYEMFSRYFEGGGKKYIPTTLINND